MVGLFVQAPLNPQWTQSLMSLTKMYENPYNPRANNNRLDEKAATELRAVVAHTRSKAL